MRNLLHSTKARVGAASVLVVAVVAMASPAFAATYTSGNAQTDTLSFAGTTVSSLAGMVTGLAGVLVALALVVWGVNTVLSKIRARHSRGASI